MTPTQIRLYNALGLAVKHSDYFEFDIIGTDWSYRIYKKGDHIIRIRKSGEGTRGWVKLPSDPEFHAIKMVLVAALFPIVLDEK